MGVGQLLEGAKDREDWGKLKMQARERCLLTSFNRVFEHATVAYATRIGASGLRRDGCESQMLVVGFVYAPALGGVKRNANREDFETRKFVIEKLEMGPKDGVSWQTKHRKCS